MDPETQQLLQQSRQIDDADWKRTPDSVTTLLQALVTEMTYRTEDSTDQEILNTLNAAVTRTRSARTRTR